MIPLNINNYIQEYFTDIDEVYSSIYLTTHSEFKYSSKSDKIPIIDIIVSKDLDSLDIDYDFKQSLQQIFSISDDEIKTAIIEYITKYS